MIPSYKKTLGLPVQQTNSVEIFFNETLTELDDPEGKVYELIKLLDGSRTPGEIATLLQISEEDVWEAIHSLDQLGCIENNNITHNFSSTELERYEANFNYFSGFANLNTDKYSFQSSLKNAKVVVLGLGGGCLTASLLAGLGVGEIVGVDYDKVERSNLNRQFIYNEDDVGRLKSEVAEEKIRKINPDIKVKMYNQLIKSYEDVLNIIEGANVVICMIDQPAIISTRWVNAACIKLGIPFYRGGFSNQFIRWERINPLLQEPCFDCTLLNRIQKDKDNINRIQSKYGKTFSGVNPGFAPNISILTGFFISDVTTLLTGVGTLMKPIVEMNMVTKEITQYEYTYERKTFCPTCSTNFKEMSTLEYLIKIAQDVDVKS